jgi:hypothetical protein
VTTTKSPAAITALCLMLAGGAIAASQTPAPRVPPRAPADGGFTEVLDSYDNPTCADGQAGAMYGQWPPLANVARRPGEWQSYEIVFEAPRFENGKLVKPACHPVRYRNIWIRRLGAYDQPEKK